MRVVVGLSGGVDSSVAALLLLEQGHEVIGLYMRNWVDESVTINNACPWVDDANDAMLVAAHLGIPFQVIDLSEAYRERIVEYMFEEYKAGRTPNPDILCNREIKFDLFREAAMQLDADVVATGHYCRKVTDEAGVHHLMTGRDSNKDQSYFLCQVQQEQLADVIFPLSELEKPNVRKIALAAGLPNATKKDSQGLCFVGKVKLPTFLQQRLEVEKGAIVEIPAAAVHADGDEILEPHTLHAADGAVVGEHPGAHFFTIGQRRGLHVGGKAEPLFVIGKDMASNTLFVGEGDQHPGLWRSGLAIASNEMHWIGPDAAPEMGAPLKVLTRIRYRQPLFGATLTQYPSHWSLAFDAPQSGVAAGQFAAIYDAQTGEEVLGSGVINA
jgi:tRNA-specific 2-thiouridylase